MLQLEEYSRLEGKLKQSIAELEKREKQLTINETQVYQTCFLFYLVTNQLAFFADRISASVVNLSFNLNQ